MKSKKIISGLLALTFVLGGTALPNTVVNNSVVASASEETEVLTYGDFEYTLLEDGTVEIVKYMDDEAKEVEIPGEIDGAAVTSIGEQAFSLPFLKSIVVPDSVTVIKDCAFEGCMSLERITLSKNLKYIGLIAFGYCGFQSIVIPDSVEYIGDSAFYYCHDLKNITLPKNLEYIQDYIFEDCSSLESIVIPDSVKYIGRYAFNGCSALNSVTFSKNLGVIGYSAFSRCPCLHDIVIPDGVEIIGDHSFASGDSGFDEDSTNCYHYSVTIPKSVFSIGYNAFAYYDSKSKTHTPLENVTINCYSGSYAEKYAKEKGLNYKLIDEKLPACPPPNLLRAEYSSEYHQIRFRWDPIKGAEKYGIAVYLSGKWRVWTNSIPASTTTFTTPKNLTPGTKYKVAVAAKVNGKWDTSDPIKKAITVTVK